MVGIRSVDAGLLELGRALARHAAARSCTTLEIPAALPSILGGLRVGVTLAVVGAIVGEWAGAEQGLGVLINLARGSLFDIPLMFATLLTIALVGIVAVPRRRPRRAPPGRCPMTRPSDPSPQPIGGSPCHRRSRPPSPLVSPASSPRRRAGARRQAVGPESPAGASASAGATGAATADPTKLVGRARLHPERPVRAVLPRRPGGLLRGRRARGRRSRTRSTPTSSRSSARATIDVGIADGTSVIPAVSQGIPVKYVATLYGKFPSIVFAKASSGITDGRRPQGQEDRHPRPLRLVVDHAPGAARVGRADARRRDDRRVPGLRPGRRRRAGRRGRRDRASSTTSPSSSS